MQRRVDRFTLLAASAYGAGGSTTGMLQALIAYRFLTGIGIGAEYPVSLFSFDVDVASAKRS